MYSSVCLLPLPSTANVVSCPPRRPCHGQGTQSSLHRGHRAKREAELPEAGNAPTCIGAKYPEVVLSPAGNKGDAKAQAEADTENEAVSPAEGVMSNDLQVVL